jgi:hypothetical protein
MKGADMTDDLVGRTDSGSKIKREKMSQRLSVGYS